MAYGRRHSKSPFVQTLVALACLLLLIGVYVALMRAALPVSHLDDRTSADYRDRVYFALHTGLVVVASAVGFGVGKWLNGLGVAYAVLFVAVLMLAMLGLQLGSFELACHGHNDLVRHWTC